MTGRSLLGPFDLKLPPRVVFGPGRIADLGSTARGLGIHAALLVTGGSSLRCSGRLASLTASLGDAGIQIAEIAIQQEPSPDSIDQAVTQFSGRGIDGVIAVGGGSVLDAGKAIAAMLPVGGHVRDYLEDVGTKTHPGITLPLVAVPTTAGTGSEATKNAVLSVVGPQGYKKSLRHDNFVAAAAIVDPELHLTCPPVVTAACGMDAFTQLLESYVSPKATPFTDALAWDGLRRAAASLLEVATSGGDSIELRSDMAYAALLSGITLANAGLGVVHGLAAVLGSMRPIAHGVACGTLLATATEANITKLSAGGCADRPALVKYAVVGELVSGRHATDTHRGCSLLVDTLEEWTETLRLPLLSDCGFSSMDVPAIVGKTQCKNNPVQLEAEAIAGIVARRIR